MRAPRKTILPPELARKISPWMVNTAEAAGPVGKTALSAFVAFLLSGGVGLARYPDLNGFMYLLGPWICPTLMALLLSALLTRKRSRAFRGSPFSYSYITDDPAVARLNEIMNSEEARRHLWHGALKLSLILFAILGTAAALLRHRLQWVLPLPQNEFLLHRRAPEPGFLFWGNFLGCSMLVFLILMIDWQRWGLMTWAKRESVHHVVKE
jgi:hypothetical protein